MLSDVRNYFDTRSHSHVYHSDPRLYDKTFAFFKKHNANRKARLLDVGCGDGSFIKKALSSGIDAVFLGTDLSYTMIKIAQKNFKGTRVELIVCDAFNLPIRSESNFDLIHLDSVLHHLVGKTRNQSTLMVKRMLKLLKEKLSTAGILIIDEVYYDSYIFPSFTSTVIFYGLKVLNYINLDISRIISDVQLGLEVNFLHTRQIKNLLDNLGSKVNLLKKDPWKMPVFYRLFLLREVGHITYSCEAIELFPSAMQGKFSDLDDRCNAKEIG